MTSGAAIVRAVALAPRWSWRLLAALAGWAVFAQIALGRGLPEVAAGRAGTALGLATGLAFLASAVAGLLEPRAWAWRISRVLLRAGVALVLLGLPASVLWRSTEILRVGEGQELAADTLPGLPPVQLGTVRLAPRSENPLLSRTVSIEARAPGRDAFEIGLWPPALVGGWRLAVLSFGYAPEVVWRDEEGRPLAEGFAMIGTFPKRDADARLVSWTPPPSLMLGVGYYPPHLEDLLTPPRSRDHLFLRLDEATLAGVRRDIRDPEAHRWLCDGRPESSSWFVQIFRGTEKLFEGNVAAGAEARFPGGSLALGRDVMLWVEIQAVRDPWLWVAAAGAIALVAGALLAGAGALRPRARP